jgi:microcystin-dependent protein
MTDYFIGEIRIFGGNFAPAGWAFCDGSLLAIAENDTLFTLIGTTYGGDGESTFALPDLRGRGPVHAGRLGGTGPQYIAGEAAGVEEVTLVPQQLPVHSHPATAGGAPTATTPAGATWSSQSTNAFAAGPATAAMAPGAIATSGHSQAHDNMPPYVAVTYIIALQGIFPPQN